MPKNGGAGLIEDVGKKGLGVVENLGSMGFKGVTGTVGKFKRTIIEHKGIAVGLMVGIATLSMIHGIVNDLFMPLLAPLLGDSGSRDWSSKEINLGPVHIKIGNLLSSFMNYFLTIIATYIFIHALE